jgi:hypothetical protein
MSWVERAGRAMSVGTGRPGSEERVNCKGITVITNKRRPPAARRARVPKILYCTVQQYSTAQYNHNAGVVHPRAPAQNTQTQTFPSIYSMGDVAASQADAFATWLSLHTPHSHCNYKRP